MSRTSTCALWEEQRLSNQDKEPKLRLSLETRVTDDLTVICCKGRIAYGIEAAALSGEIAELAPQTRRVVIDLSGVEMIDAAGLGALASCAVAAILGVLALLCIICDYIVYFAYVDSTCRRTPLATLREDEACGCADRSQADR